MKWRQIEERLHIAEAKILGLLKLIEPEARIFIEPEARIFITDNLPLVKNIVLTVERDMAGAAGNVKLDTVLRELEKTALQSLPDVKIRQSWLHFIIELAVMILKATGELK